jgi:hypothetical protein
MTVVDNGTDLTALAATDRRVARDLSAAQRDQVAARQRIADQDAATERRLREAEGRLRLAGQADEVKGERKARRAAERETARAAKRVRKQDARQARTAWLGARIEYARSNAAAVYSSVIYGLAVSGAVYGQIDAARLNQFPVLFAVVGSAAIEGTGLAMALTAQQQRLDRERATAARALVWICTGLAVAINYLGHVESNPVKAYVLSALSALGIVVFEIRSGAKHRKELRQLGMIAAPGEQFGAARWLAFPTETFAAWKLGVRDRLAPGAAALIARAELAAADRRRRARVGEVAQLARKAARKAARKGQAGPALAALVRLSHTGTPAPLLALPSPARAEADAARLALQVEVEARENAETAADEAVMEVALLRQEMEVEVARVRSEAEVEVDAVRRLAEVEVADARRRLEVEVARRVDAESRVEVAVASFHSEQRRRVEVERLATSTQERVEVEARRAAQMHGQAEAAGRGSETVQRQLAGEQAQRVEAETRAATAERVLAAEQQRLARLEQSVQATQQQLHEAVAQAADLRIQLAEAQTGSRRPRRSTPTAVAEPVLFHGRPVPVVPGAGPETVLKVLLAHEADPDAIQQALADEVGTSKRTVGAVLKAAAEQQAPSDETEATG